MVGLRGKHAKVNELKGSLLDLDQETNIHSFDGAFTKPTGMTTDQDFRTSDVIASQHPLAVFGVTQLIFAVSESQSSPAKLGTNASIGPSTNNSSSLSTLSQLPSVASNSNDASPKSQAGQILPLTKEDRTQTYINYRKFTLPWLGPPVETTGIYRKPTMPHVPGAFGPFVPDVKVESLALPEPESVTKVIDTQAIASLTEDPAIRLIGSMPSLYRKTSHVEKKSSGSLRSNLASVRVEGFQDNEIPQVRPLDVSALTKALRPSESTVASDIILNLPPRTRSCRSPVAGFIAGPEYGTYSPATRPRLAQQLYTKPSIQHQEEMLQDSITGLENLMEEAIHLTQTAVEHNMSDMVPEIVEGAHQALRNASHKREDHENAFPEVTVLFDQANHSNTDLEFARFDYSSPNTSPTFIPHRRSPSQPHIQSSQRGIIAKQSGYFGPGSVKSAGPKAVWDESPSEEQMNEARRPHVSSNAKTPPHFYRLPSKSEGVDWAYAGPVGEGSRSAARGKARLRRMKGRSLTQPEPVQPAQRDHVNFISRAAPKSSGLGNHLRRLDSLGDSPTSSEGLNDADEPASPTAGPSKPSAPNQKGFGKTPANEDGNSAPEGPNWGRDKYDEEDFMNSDTLKGIHHLTLRDDQKFSLHDNYQHQPIARNWTITRKRVTAAVACINTALLGNLIGIYSGEVPSIQYALADQSHTVILGNVVLYIGMAITTFLFWPLPLLHGRKPYTLGALAIALPLQFPQAVTVMQQRTGNYAVYRFGLLASRAVSGLALGFAFINVKTTLLDLFGASLQSEAPHGELVILDDVRRHGGGMGLWIGIWSWCFIGSLAVGFTIGAAIINSLSPQWGFWICVILLVVVLVLGVLTPETRRSPHRRTFQEVEMPNMSFSRRVARGEIRMHVKGDGPKWWWEEVLAGVYLSMRMLFQFGFAVMAIYVAWIYAEIVLIIVLLGNLLSRGYAWRAEYVGLGVLSIAIGALLAIPLSKANIFSKARSSGPRTDSMTFQPRITWTSHLVRRFIFMLMLPLSGIAYTLASGGPSTNYMVPIAFAAAIGFFSNLAMSECNGLIMETYDTSDLQPGTNSRHRLQSMAPAQKQRRTTYSSYPRVSAGFFAAHALGFLLAAAAVGVGGVLTRTVGYQKATGITAGILFGLTLLLTGVLWRFKNVQVIPNDLFGHHVGSVDASAGGEPRRGSVNSVRSDQSWRAVIIGNPSGKVRRMSILELGSLSRWTEIRRLNRLLSRSTTQALNPGWQ